MKNRKLVYGLVLIVALLFVSIGYAAVSKTLTMGGEATGLVEDKFFNVAFTETDSTGTLGQDIMATLNGTSAILDIPTLTDPTAFGASTKIKIQNYSYDLGAKLTKVKITVDGEAQEYELTEATLVEGLGYRCKYVTEYFIIVVILDSVTLDYYGVTAGVNDLLSNSTWVEVSVNFNKVPVEEQKINLTIDIIAEAVPMEIGNVSVPQN